MDPEVDMADFVLPERIVTIVLDEGDYAGVEATVRLPKAVGTYWQVRRLIAARDEGESDEEYEARQRAFYDFAAAHIFVAWNVADHAGPIPTDADGLARADATLVGTLLGYWNAATEQSPFVRPSPSSKPSGRRPRQRVRKPR